MERLTWEEAKKYLVEFNRSHNYSVGAEVDETTTVVIVFTSDSFLDDDGKIIEYSEEARSYAVSSNNKAFIDGMTGYSIYGGSLDGSDPCTRLENYMADEYGGPKGWKVDYCYIKN